LDIVHHFFPSIAHEFDVGRRHRLLEGITSCSLDKQISDLKSGVTGKYDLDSTFSELRDRISSF
jgi:hypothetical protein